jgi:hypothetical protein
MSISSFALIEIFVYEQQLCFEAGQPLARVTIAESGSGQTRRKTGLLSFSWIPVKCSLALSILFQPEDSLNDQAPLR